MLRRQPQKKRLFPVLMLNEGEDKVAVETTGTSLQVDTAKRIINSDR